MRNRGDMGSSEAEKRVDIGADVMGSDGEKIGTVAYVVVHPNDMHVAEVVVSTGAVLGRDVVIPVDVIDRVADGGVYLSVAKGQLGRYPDYVAVDFKQPPTSMVPAPFPYYPVESTLWPAELSSPEVSSVTVNAPPHTVGFYEGMAVKSSDGHKVGSIDGVETNATGQDVVAIVVKHGVLFSHDVTLPVDCISGTENDEVTLNLARDEVERKFESG
jgi:uncharacterized protein YrrD